MPGLPARAFATNAMRNTMGSNAWTDSNQGGGSKKAGLPSSVGLDSNWVHIYYNERHIPQNLTLMRTQPIRKPMYANPSRPIGSSVTSNISFWHIPGTGK
jgi:hypothetical protein